MSGIRGARLNCDVTSNESSPFQFGFHLLMALLLLRVINTTCNRINIRAFSGGFTGADNGMTITKATSLLQSFNPS